jgi:hypothetical protein
LSRGGKKSSVNGTIVIVNIELDDYRVLAPVLIPDLEEIRAFARELHRRRQPWEGEAFGWSAGYKPSSPEPPPGSKMTFTPADFWIGDGAIWFLALMWEAGDDQPPVETVYDKNIVVNSAS